MRSKMKRTAKVFRSAEGTLLPLQRMYPSALSARQALRGGKARVIDGPFTESKEVFGG